MLGYSPRVTNMMLEVKNFTKIFDSMRIRLVNQSYPPNKFFGPPIGGVRGVTYNWHPYKSPYKRFRICKNCGSEV